MVKLGRFEEQLLVLNASVLERVELLQGVASVDDLIGEFRSSGMQGLVLLALGRLVPSTLRVSSLVIQNVLQNVALFALANFDECSSRYRRSGQLAAAGLAIKLHSDSRHRYSGHVLLVRGSLLPLAAAWIHLDVVGPKISHI